MSEVGALAWVVTMLTVAAIYAHLRVPSWIFAVLGAGTLVYCSFGTNRLFGSLVWWIGIAAIVLIMALTTRQPLLTALLTIAAIFFSTTHEPPYGPLAMLGFLLAVALIKFGGAWSKRQPASNSLPELRPNQFIRVIAYAPIGASVYLQTEAVISATTLRRSAPWLYPLAMAGVLLLLYQQSASVSVGAGQGDEAALGNFYAPQHDNGRDYRWSKYESNITLARISDAEHITLTLSGARPTPAPPAASEIWVDGSYVTTISLTNQIADYSFDYHDLSLDPRLTITLRPTATFYLSDQDYRAVGVIYYAARAESNAAFGLLLPPPSLALLWLLLIVAVGGLLPAAYSPRVRFAAYLVLPLFALLIWIGGPLEGLPLSGAITLLLLPLSAFVQRAPLETWLARGAGWLRGWRIWHVWLVHAVAVPLFYLIATIIFTWPYILDLPRRVPGWPMDNFNFLYKIWWVGNALFGNPPPGSSLTYNPNVFYPAGFNLAQGELTPANTLATIPTTAIFGPIVSYNLLVLLSFVVSGWGMYLLVRYLLDAPPLTPTPPRYGGGSLGQQGGTNPALIGSTTQNSKLKTQNSTLIALLAGLAFAFCPYRMTQMGGHLQMLGTEWLPLTFLFLEKMVRRRRWQDGLIGGIFFALCCWEAWYYAAIIGLFVPLYLALRWWQLRRAGQQVGINPAPTPNPPIGAQSIAPSTGGINHAPTNIRYPQLKTLLAFIVAVAIMVGPFALPYLQLRDTGSLAYSEQLANQNSAVPTDYFLPSELHPLWGETFMQLHRWQNPLEDNLYLGVVPLGLFGFALAGWRRERRQAASPLANFPFMPYLLISALAFVLSFGLGFHIGVLFDKLKVGGSDPNATLWLPGWLLYKFVPLFSAIRAYARFGLIVTLAVIVLAALGLAMLLARPRFAPYRRLTIVALTIVLLCDFAANPYAFGMSRVESQPLDVWLAAQVGNTPVTMFPTDYAQLSGPAMWSSVYHGKPITYGYESFLPALFQRPDVAQPLASFPNDQRVWPLLQGWGIKYVLVATYWWGTGWPKMRDQLAVNPHLRYITHFQERRLWDGNVRLWTSWPDFAWHAQPEDVWIYQLLPD